MILLLNSQAKSLSLLIKKEKTQLQHYWPPWKQGIKDMIKSTMSLAKNILVIEYTQYNFQVKSHPG